MRAVWAAVLALTMLAAGCAPAPPQTGAPALWRIADEDSEIWLFGSVHVLPRDLHWRSDAVEAAFAAADEFVTETDTSDAATAQVSQLMAQHGALPPGQTLSALIGRDEAHRVARAARDLGADPAALERTRPWLAALHLSYLYAARSGHSAEAGVEAVLTREAHARGMRLSYFESPEQQVRILADLSPEAEQRFLAVTVREIENDAGALAEMDRAWASGDTAELARLLDADWDDAGGEVHEAVILRRNRAWADEIERRLDGSGAMFIAVGAAHLVGEGSVVALLRARGIEVDGP